MTIQNLISHTIKMQGNLIRSNDVYISSHNMDLFVNQLEKLDAKQGILITPYLIVNNGGLYELHYYEFDIEVRGDKSYYVEFNPRNTLPIEITENLKPQVIIAIGDKVSYCEAVERYLVGMKKMVFTEDKECHPELQNAQLFYQIFVNSDLS